MGWIGIHIRPRFSIKQSTESASPADRPWTLLPGRGLSVRSRDPLGPNLALVTTRCPDSTEPAQTRTMFRVDLHAHTNYSHDAHTSPQDLVRRAREVGLDRIAVTDHGTIQGALRAKELDPDLVIVGEEVRCECNAELIGLFLTERIPMRLPLSEVVERIRDQGGVVYAPHPFAYPREPRRRAARALAVADVVEAINARAFLPWWNRAASRAAAERGIPQAAGSDAHFAFEIGRAHTVMPQFDTAETFKVALSDARPRQLAVSGPSLHVASLGINCGRRASRALSSLSPILPRTRVARAS